MRQLDQVDEFQNQCKDAKEFVALTKAK